MDAKLRAALVALLEKIDDSWTDGCGCCGSETFDSRSDETVAVQALLDAEQTATPDAWTHVADALPEALDDFGTFSYSREVLAWSEGRAHLAILQRNYNDNGKRPRVGWKIAGRDGYTLDGVTHWQDAPKGPGA